MNRSARRGRRWIAASALLLVAALIVWQLAERFIGAEQLRPVLERELANVFGLPATIDTLDIRWLPQPHLAARGVTLGQKAFKIHADAVSAEANFGSLWRGVIRLGRISSNAIRINLPADETQLSQDLDTVTSHLFGPREDSGDDDDSNIEIGEIALANIAVYRGNSHAADITLEIHDVLGPVVRVTGAASAPMLGPTAQLATDITIDSQAAGDSAVSGTIETTDFPLAPLLDVPLISTYALTGAGALSGTVPGRIQLAAEGHAHSATNPELDGAFTGNLWYRDGQIDINDLRLDGEQIQAVADISIPDGGGFACRIQRGALDNAALATVAQAILPTGFLTFSDAGRMTVLDLLFGQEGDAPLRFSEGEASFLQLEVQRGAGGVLRDLSARVSVQENALSIEDLSNDFVHLSGAIAPDFETGATRVALQGTADLSPQLLRLLVDDSRITAASGRIRLDTIEGTLGADDAPLLVVARLEEASVQVQQDDGQALSVDTIHGGIRYESGILTLENLTGAGFTLSGILAPEPPGWAFDLHGQGDLSNPLVALVLPPQLKSAAGAVELKTLRGRWQPGLALPADLALEGAIREGRLQIDSPSYAGQLSGITGSFNTDSEAITTDLRFDAEHLGAARIAGRYLFAESRWVGEADLNLPAIAGLFLSGARADRWVEALLANQRDAKLTLSVDLPETPGAPVTLALEARSASGITGSIECLPADSGFTLGKIDLRGAVSAAAIAPILLDGLQGQGTLACRFNLDSANKRFTATADLKAATLSWGEWIRKPSGIEGAVEIAGATEPAWAIADCQVRLLGQALRVRPKGAGFAAEPFTLDLAALAPLLPSGAGARGALRGQFATSPAALDLELDAVTLPLPGGAGSIQADGAVQHKAGLWSFDNLHLQGPRTDCVITAAASDGGWRGQLQGPSLDLDAAVLLVALGRGGQSSSGGGAAKGALDVSLGQVYFGRGALAEVHGQLEAGTGIRFTGATARLGTGAASGEIAWSGEGNGQLALKLTFDNADLAAIEALLFAEARGMTGEVSGSVDLLFPAGNSRAALRGLTGAGSLVAEKGSYGHTTLATRLLNIARTVEVLYLRLPSLNETGLTFDTSRLQFQADDGRLQVQEFTLGTRSYGFEATGVIDFNADKTDMTGKIYAFEAVTGILGSVPVLGSTVDKFKKLIALPVRISGSAFEPEVAKTVDDAGVEMVPEPPAPGSPP